MKLDYETLLALKKAHPAWRLLSADHAPLIVSFLNRVFLKENARDILKIELISKLEDELFVLRQMEGEDKYPRLAEEYLEEWAQDDKGWLRKFYPTGSDEPAYDITSSTEKAIAWLEGLTAKKFVGTESRLMIVFELLRQIVDDTEVDPDKRIIELQKKKREIDKEIDALRDGHITRLNSTALQDRALQLESTAMELLRDFREVEGNFRQLDKEVREKIATWDGHKGELLEEIFLEKDAISDSDQGRSFQAFYSFLMSFDRKEELRNMLEKVMGLDTVQELQLDPRLKGIHNNWLDAANHTQRTFAKLSQQLRRFLDDKTYLENKRIIEILQNIQTMAVDVRENLPQREDFMELDDSSPTVLLPFERPLFTPPIEPLIDGKVVDADGTDIDADILFEQFVVDRAKLEGQINTALQTRGQVSLGELTRQFPVEKGLAELVCYLAIAAEKRAVFDETQCENIILHNDVAHKKQVQVPRVIFIR